VLARGADRRAIPSRESWLSFVAFSSAGLTLAWVLVAWGASARAGVPGSVLALFCVGAAVASGIVCAWSGRRLVLGGTALIVDEAGLLDNVSLVSAGRIRWDQVERIWIAGPRWMPLLCVLPFDCHAYVARQEDPRRTLMRASWGLLGAPIVIPVRALSVTSGELRTRIGAMAPARS